MSVGRVGLGRGLALASALGIPASVTAQLTTSLDAGVSRVTYDGFLPSSAVSITPALRLAGRTWSAGARGTYLRFESGNHSTQGLLTGSAYTPPLGHWRAELSAAAGASTYREFPALGYLLGRARVHLILGDRGAWGSAGLGQLSSGSGARPITSIAAGAWARRYPFTLSFSATHSTTGDTAYTDVEGSARVTHRALEIEGAMGARLWSSGAGRGVYGEASASLPLGNRFTMVMGVGRYPSDPTHGSVAGRYVSAGLRVAGLTAPSSPSAPSPPAAQYAGPSILRLVHPGEGTGETAGMGTDGHIPDASLEVTSRKTGLVVIVVRAPWAHSVEIMGDFTDWEAVALLSRGDGTWTVALPIPTGAHHLNVRLDGGVWGVPQGATVAADEFDGRVGAIIVP